MEAVAQQQRRRRFLKCSALTVFSVCVLFSSLVFFHFLVGRGVNVPMASQGRVLCYGDSLTAGYHSFGRSFNPYGKRLQSMLGPQFKVEWIGLSGWTTSQLLDSAENDVTSDFTGSRFPGLRSMLKKGFDLVIAMAGTNDIGHGRQPQDIVGNLESLYDIMREEGVPRVLSVGVPDSAFVRHNSEANGRRNAVNAALRSLAGSGSSGNFTLRYVDCPVSHAGGDPFEPDGLHFASVTYDRLGERLFPVVKEMLGQTSA